MRLFLMWIRNIARRSDVEDALDEEMRTCVDILTEERVRAGMDPGTARREALMEIGNVDVVKECVRDVRRGSRLELWWRDLRHGLRSLRRQPGTTAAVIVTLAVGIGVPTTVFSLLADYAFRAPATSDADAYVRVVRDERHAQGVATTMLFETMQAETTSLREVAAWSSLYMSTPLGTDDPTRLKGLFASCNVFAVLGVSAPVAGRLLTPDDCRSDQPVAVIGEQAWRTRFHADPGVVGRTLAYGGVPVTVVGVAAAPAIQRRAHDIDPPEVVDVWVPYTAFAPLRAVLDSPWDLLSPTNRFPWLEVAGLLAAGASRESATAELRSIDAQVASTEPLERARQFAGPIVLTDGTVWSRMPETMLELMGMALMLPVVILVAACVNAAGLLLSRRVGREKEMATRLALGAGRAALLRLLFVEGLVLAVLAGTASVLLVLTVPRLLTRFWGAEAALGTGGAVLPDWRVFAFLTAIGLFAALLTSLAPALEARSLRVSEALQGTRRRIGRTGRFRMRQAFVAVQVGACCVLLVVAGSVVRTVSTYTQPDIRTDGLLTIELWEGDQVTSRLVDLATELTAIPGVRAVAASDLLPLVRETGLRMVTPGGTDDLRPYPVVADVSPAYFNVFDIPLEAGRHFAASDWVPGGARPVVVSRQFAERVFGGTRAVGQTIVESGPDEGRLAIVGIVGNRLTGLSMLGPAMTDGSVVYRLLDPAATAGHLTIWTAGDPTMVAESVATRLRQLTGSARTIEPFASVLAERSMMARNLVLLLVALGGIALLLAVLALIASVTADAARRTREFAIRIALGASPGTVRRHVVRAGVGILPIGIAVGLLASWGVLRLVEAQRILPLASIAQDPVTYGGVLAVVTGTAFLAVFRIAIRVAGRDPLPALREE